MLRTLTRIAISRGLFGGSRRWVGVGTVVVSLRALARLANKEPKLVYSEDLAPGESLVITHLTSHVQQPVNGPFTVGERVLLIDGKSRRYLVTLREEGQFHTHAGITAHADIVGRDDGVTVRSGTGARYTVVRPTLSDFVLAMPRGAQVIYPKDLGPLLVLADIFAGARVLEAGVGSGALSMALLRAGAHVVGYEIRDDFSAKAQANVASFLGPGTPYRVEARDIYEGVDETGLDRVMLDLPEPWRVVGHAESALRPGGILVAYLPTIGQVSQFRQALGASAFGLARTIEVLERSWHVEGQSVRPDHRMVGHTGFLTSARLLGAEDPPA